VAKADEIDYIKHVARVEGVTEEAFRRYLLDKPYSDARCGDYLMDVGQIMRVLPPPPARLLDVGVGSGWTSALFALRGYDVLGLDISPDMIALAGERDTTAKFAVCDYEVGPIPAGFDIAVIYDSLHHAESEAAVIDNVYGALVPGGMLVTVEPGIGHAKATKSREVTRKYGTTEKDMSYRRQRRLMRAAGFKTCEQYVRLSRMPLRNVGHVFGSMDQVLRGSLLTGITTMGVTSMVVARK
jgi:SAM-dependent methyltransferase